MSRIDRIAEPRGTRTPYEKGESWPVHVDGLLDGGLPEDDVDDCVTSASILSSDGHALGIAVEGQGSALRGEVRSAAGPRRPRWACGPGRDRRVRTRGTVVVDVVLGSAGG